MEGLRFGQASDRFVEQYVLKKPLNLVKVGAIVGLAFMVVDQFRQRVPPLRQSVIDQINALES